MYTHKSLHIFQKYLTFKNSENCFIVYAFFIQFLILYNTFF